MHAFLMSIKIIDSSETLVPSLALCHITLEWLIMLQLVLSINCISS
jgi:hypothetical protein